MAKVRRLTRASGLRLREWWGNVVIPTEILFVHASVVGYPVVTGLAVGLGKEEWEYVLGFCGCALLLYWTLRLLVRKPGRASQLERWWLKQVEYGPKTRFSSAVLIILASSAHLFFALAALFVGNANLLYRYERGDELVSWLQAMYASLALASLGFLTEFEPRSSVGNLVSILNAFSGIVFAALWAAIFVTAFEAIFLVRFRR
jgi:hypothetical protein